MFVGMSLLIFNTDYWHFCACPRGDPMKPSPGWMLFPRVGIPAICDLLATVLERVALRYRIPSIWQVFCGSTFIFTAILAVLYRH
jgi:hypothetical protein